MIEIDGKLINPAHVVSAEVETRHLGSFGNTGSASMHSPLSPLSPRSRVSGHARKSINRAKHKG